MDLSHTDPSAPASSDEEPSLIRRRPVRIVIYAGLAIFIVLMVVWPMIAHLRDPDFQKHIEQHRVMAGMSKEQVLQAWGGPQTINTSFTKDGVRREEWIFEDWESTAVVKHRYLYFEEGVLIGGWYEGAGERQQPQFPADSPHPKIRP
jgi:hypothetical protein